MSKRTSRTTTALKTLDEREVAARNMRAMQAAELRVEPLRARRALDHGWL
ncbi:hypothetical protein [Humidisolicoccus flavus]